MLTPVFFSGPWCVVCKALKPHLEGIAHEYVDIGTPEGEVLALQYSITQLPTIIFIDEATGEEKGVRKTGGMSPYEMKKFIERGVKE